MDKKKILSSLAAAGILTASVLGANVNAATGANYVGVYKNLVEGKTVVPYILPEGDNITVKDVQNDFENIQLVNGSSVIDSNKVIVTGDTIKSNDVEYTLLVYGDANGDGKVSTLDALRAQEIALGMGEPASDVIRVATDVANDLNNIGHVSTADAQRIQAYALRATSELVTNIPVEEEPEQPENTQYTVTANDNGYINAINYSATQLKISLEETFDKEKTLTVKASGMDNDGADKTKELGTITIPAHTDYIETAKLSTPVTFNFSDFKDGEIRLQLLDGKEVVSTITVTKNTEAVDAAQVITKRTSTKNATLSLIGSGKTDVTKVYYIVVANDNGTSAPASGETIDDIDAFFNDDKKDVRKEASVANNTLADEVVSTELATNTTYTVYYVVENTYGTRSELKAAIISTDEASATQPEKIEEIKVPENLNGTTAEFSWEGETGVTYKATLYKDGVAVAEEDVTESTGTWSVDFAAEMSEAGTYKVSVYAPAKTTSKASEVTESAEVKVEKLAAVTNLAFRNEKEGRNSKVILSWDNSVNKDDFANYEILLYSVDEEGNETLEYTIDDSENTIENDKTEVDLTSQITANTVYVAKVRLIAKNEVATTDSDQVESSEFFKVEFPEVDADGLLENQITLNINEITINGEKATYRIEVCSVNENYDETDSHYEHIEYRDVEVKDGKIVIDGLDSNTPYGFKLFVNVAGEEIASDYSSPIRTIPEFNNVKVVANDADNRNDAGNVYVDSGSVYLAGEEIDVTDYSNSTKLGDILTVIKALLPGEAINVDGDKITITLDAGATTTAEARDLSGLALTRADKTILEFVNNGFNKDIKTPTGDNQVKEVILSGDALFDLTNINAEKITVTNGVEVNGNKEELTIAANSTVTINNAEVTTEKETVIGVSANTLTVSANEEANDLVFVNNGGTLTIEFEGNEQNTSVQSGSIVIKSTGGSVTLSSNGANVDSELTIEVNSGVVDIKEPSFTGDKNVTVSVEEGKTSTINIVANTKAPATLTDVSVDLTDEELREVDNVTDDNFDDVKAFLQSFGLSGTGAKITAIEDDDKVTITFKAAEDSTIDNVVIDNIK